MTGLNSKERVLTAVALAEPDRVPMDFLPNPWVTERLHRDLGTTTHRELLERLHSDIVDLRGVVDPAYCGPIPQRRELVDGVRENFWGWRQKVMQSATGPEDSFVEFILADAASIEDFLRHRWPAVDWFDFSDFAARLALWRDFAVMASGASVFQHPTFLRGIDQLLMDMAVQRLQFLAANALRKPPRLPRCGPEVWTASLKPNRKSDTSPPTYPKDYRA